MLLGVVCRPKLLEEGFQRDSASCRFGLHGARHVAGQAETDDLAVGVGFFGRGLLHGSIMSTSRPLGQEKPSAVAGKLLVAAPAKSRWPANRSWGQAESSGRDSRG